MRIQYYPSDSSDDNDFNFSFLFTGHSPNWDASWISDSNTKSRSTSSPPAFPQGTGQESRINQEHRQARGRGGRGGRGRNHRGGRGWDQGYQRSVSDSKYAARSAHFQDTKRTNERTIASEGGLRNTSRKSSDSSSKRFERNGKTHTRDSGATSRDTNSSDSSTRSERGESSIGSVNSNDSGAWCTVTHRRGSSQRTDGTDPRTFDNSLDRRSFDPRKDSYNRGRGERSRGNRGSGGRGGSDRGRGNWGRGDRGRGATRGRGDSGMGGRGRGDRGRRGVDRGGRR